MEKDKKRTIETEMYDALMRVPGGKLTADKAKEIAANFAKDFDPTNEALAHKGFYYFAKEFVKKRAYKHETQIFNPEAGESVTAVNNEDDYVKVYRYLNSVFAFKGINQSFIPCLMEISNYMSFADKGQEVVLNERYRKQIADTLNISVKRVNDIITGLKKADVLRPIMNADTGKPYRSTFAVNPFIIGRGKWSDIKELRAQFDYSSGLITTQSVVEDKITGETMAKITQEVKKGQKGIP